MQSIKSGDSKKFIKGLSIVFAGLILLVLWGLFANFTGRAIDGDDSILGLTLLIILSVLLFKLILYQKRKMCLVELFEDFILITKNGRTTQYEYKKVKIKHYGIFIPPIYKIKISENEEDFIFMADSENFVDLFGYVVDNSQIGKFLKKKKII